VQGAVLAAVGRPADEDLAVLLDDLDVARDALGELALRPFTSTRPDPIVTVTPSGMGMGCLPIRDMGSYQISATTSPPTRAWRASCRS
jgi:hypothetical protein